MKRILLLTIFISSSHICFSQTWKQYGLGFEHNGVSDFIVFNNELYAGGDFYSFTSSLDNIGKWDGTNWNTVGPGMLGGINGFTIYNGDLVAAGGFSLIPGVPNAHKIARWDGNSWYSLSAGVTSGIIRAIATYNGNVYIGGNFSSVDSMPIYDIARWDGSTWHSVCTLSMGLSQLFCMTVFNNELYIGGYFDRVNGDTVYNIAKFNGTTWNDVGGGLNSDVFGLYTDTINNRLYAGGNFNYAGNGTVSCPSNVAYWDGSSWNAIGLNGPALHPTTICSYKSNLYIGNNLFPVVNQLGDTLNSIAFWNGNYWMPLGNGVDCSVLGLHVYNDELLVGGCFIHAGNNLLVNDVAAWVDSTTGIKLENSFTEQIKVVPNPFNASTTVSFSNPSSKNLPFTFKLYNSMGEEAIQLDNIFSTTFTISKNNLRAGIYFYKLFDRTTEIGSGKLVVE